MKQQQKKGFRPADDSGIPVPSRFLLVEALTESGSPMTFAALCQVFDIRDEESQAAITSRLERLQNQGVVIVDRKGRYALPDKMGAFTGRVIGHNDGYGYVRPDQGGDDLYLHHRQMRKVLHGDRVLAKVKSVDSRGRKEGVIVEVLVDPDREIVGHFDFQDGVGFVEPDDSRFGRDITIPMEHKGNAQAGDIVVVRIIHHPVQHQHAVGMIVNIMGSELAPGMETDIAIRKHEIPNEWPEAVDKQIDKHARKFQEAKPGKGREDLRDLPLVTIDGSDARDFDDAVFCKPNRQGWRLVVAIADVSHYVQVDSALDTEAYNRGNSVYFPNRVVPMLPEVLSNGICSLNPDEDRCCMVCDMQLSRTGIIQDYEFYPGLMHSKARLTYEIVAQVVDDQDPAARKEWDHVVPHLDNLYKLFQKLSALRGKRGTINFEFPEPMIHFDDNQRIESVSVRERNVAHKMIEECMLAANVCAGELIQDHFGEQGIYRNHAGPEQDALGDLRAFLKGLGFHLGGGDEPGAGDYSKLLKDASSRPQVLGVVQSVLLRSLSQAVYSPEQIGHFALAFPVYTHFTSPIRRYPDLVVHRLIRNIIDGSDNPVGAGNKPVAEIGEHCSFTDRRAEDATRDVIAWLKAEYMEDKIGEEFDGVVSGVKEFGVFVQLDDIFVDGLVHVTALGNDYYRFDPVNFQLVGDRSGRRFRLGDRIRIIVSKVNLDQAKIDFELAGGGEQQGGDTKEEGTKRRSARKKRSTKSPDGDANRSGGKKPSGKSTKKKSRKRG